MFSFHQEIKDRERAKEAARAVVDSHLHRRATQIEIRPKFLLPDTNCYIDHLKCEETASPQPTLPTCCVPKVAVPAHFRLAPWVILLVAPPTRR